MSYVDQHLANSKHTDYPRQLVDYLVSRYCLSRKTTVVDFGCGMGGYSIQWKKHCKVIGVDLVDVTRHCTGIPIWVLDLSKENARVPLRQDVVFSKSVIEHLPDAKNYLSNAHKALKQGGLLLVMTPDWKTSYKAFYDDYTHCRPYTITSLKEVVPEASWEAVEVELFWQVPLAWKYPLLFKAVRWVRWFMPEGDLKRRMSHAALLLTARRK